jgi:hypothetical protein
MSEMNGYGRFENWELLEESNGREEEKESDV